MNIFKKVYIFITPSYVKHAKNSYILKMMNIFKIYNKNNKKIIIIKYKKKSQIQINQKLNLTVAIILKIYNILN